MICKRDILILPIAIVFVALIYGPYINTFYAMEDLWFQEVSRINSINEITNLFLLRWSGFNYRPMSTFIPMSINWALFGPNPVTARLLNYCILVLTAILIYMICKLLFAQRVAAFVTAILFLTHPRISHVFFLSSLQDLLVGFLLLLSLFAYMKCSQERYHFLIIISWISYGLALLSKETAVFFPLIIFCYTYLFADVNRSRWPFILKGITGFVALASLYLLVRFYFLKITLPQSGLYARDFSLFHVLKGYSLFIYYCLYNFKLPQLVIITSVVCIVLAYRLFYTNRHVQCLFPCKPLLFCILFIFILQSPVVVLNAHRDYHVYCSLWAMCAILGYFISELYYILTSHWPKLSLGVIVCIQLAFFILVFPFIRTNLNENSLINEVTTSAAFHQKCLSEIREKVDSFPPGSKLYFHDLPFGDSEDPYIYFESLVHLYFDTRPHRLSVKLFWPHEEVVIVIPKNEEGKTFIFWYSKGELNMNYPLVNRETNSQISVQ